MKKYGSLLSVLLAVGLAVVAEGLTVPSAKRPAKMQPKAAVKRMPRSLMVGLGGGGVDVTLGELDLTTIAREDAQAATEPERLLRIGVGRELPQCPEVTGAECSGGNWTSLADGARIWRWTVAAPGAVGLRLNVDNLELPVGAELLVFDANDPTESHGPYTSARLLGRREFWSSTVFSDTVTLECYLPAEQAEAVLGFEVGKVAHVYRDLTALPLGMGCHNDASCYPEWSDEAQAVAGVGIIRDGDHYFCCGTLLNDTDTSTWIDYFLTANHAVANQQQANDLEFYWFYQTAYCGGPEPSIWSIVVTGYGADFLVGKSWRTGSDFTLLRLREESPVGATYNGWTTESPGDNATLTCIHHPEGEFKRISFGRLDFADRDFWYVYYTSGVTEPGSSGAPLFDQYGYVIGQLYGGTSACDNPAGIDAYGRFSASFEQLKPWLARGSGSLMPASNPIFGSYPGYAFDERDATYEVCGTATMTASKTGKVSAKVVMQQKSLSFKSAKWQGRDGEWFVVKLYARGGEVLEIEANWNFAFGTMYGGMLGDRVVLLDFSYDIFKERTDLLAQSDLTNLRGYYTVGLPVVEIMQIGAAEAVPQGSGYLGMTVGNRGRVKIAGKLADGTKVSQGSHLILMGDYGDAPCVPLFKSLYSRKRGAVSGLLWIDPDLKTLWGDYENNWALWWDKPPPGADSFVVRLLPYGGIYNKSAPLERGYLLYAQESFVPYYVRGVAAALPQEVFPQWVDIYAANGRMVIAKGVKPKAVDGVYDYFGVNPTLATLRFTGNSAIYKGKFNLYYDYMNGTKSAHKAVKVSYEGVLTQRYDTLTFDSPMPTGQGFYLVADRAPLYQALRLKRSYWADIYAAP